MMRIRFHKAELYEFREQRARVARRRRGLQKLSISNLSFTSLTAQLFKNKGIQTRDTGMCPRGNNMRR